MPRVSIGDVGLEYRLTGDPASSRGVVALLNGIGMSLTHWDAVSARLAGAGYAVLAHDFRGQLLSDRPAGPYSLELHAADLAALLDALGLGCVGCIGTSYGAEVALAFARDYPGRCAALACIDGVSEADALLRAVIASWRATALADPRLFYKGIVPWNYSAAYLAANGAALAAREDLIASLPRDYFEAFARLCDAFLAIDLTKDLGALRVPCLALAGAEDLLKPPRYSRLIAEGVAGARYEELPGCGHAVVVERPEALAEALLRFLGEAL